MGLVIGFLGSAPLTLTAQAHPEDSVRLNIDRLFELVTANNPTLKVSEEEINIAKQNVNVTKNNRLPNANVSTSAYYLGDVDIFNPSFKKQATQSMPHFGHNVGLEANQLLWKGGQVRESIKLSELQVDIAGLQYTSAEQQARLTALGFYLDLYKLHNQSKVYAQNIQLAVQRLENINRFAKQGMVTRNDVIRGELMISNLRLQKLTVDNHIQILNQQLNVALGLPEPTTLVPDEALLNTSLALHAEEMYQETARGYNPNVLLSKKAVEIQHSAWNLAKKNMYPALSAFAGNTLQRPLTSSIPARDLYANSWNVGLALSFDLGNLWKNKQTVHLRKQEMNKALAQQREVEAYISVGIRSAYIKHGEALIQNETLGTNRDLAEENYRIMEKKYNHQLAIILDLMDAANAKLDAELQYTNSEVNIIYAYYKLMKETGKI